MTAFDDAVLAPDPAMLLPGPVTPEFWDSLKGVEMPKGSEHPLPNMLRIPMQVHGRDVPIIMAPVDDSHTPVVFLTGLNSTTPYYNREISLLNRLGYSGTITNFPSLGDDCDFSDMHREVVRQVLIDNPPFDTSQRPVLVAHSIACLYISELLHDPETAAIITERFRGGIFMAPFYGMTTEPAVRLAYKLQSTTHRDQRVGDSLPDQMRNAFRKHVMHEPDTRSSVSELLHGQIEHALAQGKAFRGRIRHTGFPDATLAFPLSVILGAKDGAASSILGARVGRQMGADLYEVKDGFHNPFLEKKEARALFVELLGALSNDERKPQLKQSFRTATRRKESLFRSFIESPTARYATLASLGIAAATLAHLNGRRAQATEHTLEI